MKTKKEKKEDLILKLPSFEHMIDISKLLQKFRHS